MDGNNTIFYICIVDYDIHGNFSKFRSHNGIPVQLITLTFNEHILSKTSANR